VAAPSASTSPPPTSPLTPPDADVPDVEPTSVIVKLMSTEFSWLIATWVWLTASPRITISYSCGRMVPSAITCAGLPGARTTTNGSR